MPFIAPLLKKIYIQRVILCTSALMLCFDLQVKTAFAQNTEIATPVKPSNTAQKTATKPSDQSEKAATTAVGITQSPWTKVCGKAPGSEKETCLTGQEVRSEQGQFLASVAVEEIDGKKTIRVAVPVGLLIQPGLVVRADDLKGVPARFTVCLPNACFASIDSVGELVTQMKKSKDLLIAGRNMQGKEINISMPLSGFGAAQDGPALDTKALEQQQKQLQESLQKKAEEERKKLLEKPADKK